MNYRIGFIGAGKMGGAILSAVLEKCGADGGVAVCDANRGAAERFAARGAAVLGSPAELAAQCATLVVAVKPQDFDALLSSIAPLGDRLVVSIAAGKTLATMRRLLGPSPRLVRVMPNLAALVGEGLMAYVPDASATDADLGQVRGMLRLCGVPVALPESQFDAVTALSGSGPAFFAWTLEAMAQGAVRLGMPEGTARLLALQTMLGTARYLGGTGQDVAAFIRAVCSPKGTTEAGMRVLEASPAAETFAQTIAAAARRSAELSM